MVCLADLYEICFGSALCSVQGGEPRAYYSQRRNRCGSGGDVTSSLRSLNSALWSCREQGLADSRARVTGLRDRAWETRVSSAVGPAGSRTQLARTRVPAGTGCELILSNVRMDSQPYSCYCREQRPGTGDTFSGPDERLASPPLIPGRSSSGLQVAGCRRPTLGSRSAFFRVSHGRGWRYGRGSTSLAAVNYGRRGRPRLDALKGGRRATTCRPPSSYGGMWRRQHAPE